MTIGRYEQDDDSLNGREGIAWIVLERNDQRAVLISKYALDAKPFGSKS